jgi:hypothetical protein
LPKLLIDLEEDKYAKAVIWGLLREVKPGSCSQANTSVPAIIVSTESDTRVLTPLLID